jgi:hypothetical protein
MDQAWRNSESEPMRELGDTEPLEAVRAELEDVEALAQTIRDLTALLQARLAPEQFRLVWALRDAVERLAIADDLLRRRRLADALARHLPPSAPALLAIRQQILADEPASDEPI